MKRIARVTVASLILGVAMVSAPMVGARSAQADEVQTVRATAVQVAQEKAETNKQRVCEQKQTKLQDRLGKVAQQGTKQLEVFDKISTRVQDFATTKELTVENYTQLLADVDSARKGAVTATEVAVEAPKVDCTSVDPKASLNMYQEQVKARNEALKKYKTSIKNLIVAVKKSQGQQTSVDKPTATDTTESTGGAE